MENYPKAVKFAGEANILLTNKAKAVIQKLLTL